MSSRHLVDPSLEAFLQAPPVEITAETLPIVRVAIGELYAAGLGPADPTVSVEERLIPGAAGSPDVKVMIFTPPGPKTARPALLHIHGGGYIFGDAAMNAPMSQARARALDCVVVSVDYRLAPETAYPGPVEDCYAALCWMVANAQALGIDPTRVVVGGESAGGGLSAATCLMARERGGPAVALQFLIYPMLDHRTATPADPYGNGFSGEFAWTHQANRFGWSAMFGAIDPAGEVPATLSPSRAKSLAGLPPAFIAVGALDLFVDEDIDYAARLAREGVPVELHVYPGAFHAFDMVQDAPVTIQFKDDCARALNRAFKR
jgi:acetyl esterase/lipase